jgi:hypothetical protein
LCAEGREKYRYQALSRPWREIAAEAAIELDSGTMLTEALARALDDYEQKLRSPTHEQAPRKAG